MRPPTPTRTPLHLDQKIIRRSAGERWRHSDGAQLLRQSCGRRRRQPSSSMAWSAPMRTFLSPPFSRFESTTTRTRRSFPSRERAGSRSTPEAATTQLHGGFIIRARNSLFDARNPLADEKLPFSRDGYEANISGPIVQEETVVLPRCKLRAAATEPAGARLPSFRRPADRRAFAGHARPVPGAAGLAADAIAPDRREVRAASRQVRKQRHRRLLPARVLQRTFSIMTTASKSQTNTFFLRNSSTTFGSLSGPITSV